MSQITKLKIKGISISLLIVLIAGCQLNKDHPKATDSNHAIVKIDSTISAGFVSNHGWLARAKIDLGKVIVIIDTIYGNYYSLDSTHTLVTAHDKSNKVLWQTNPRKDYPFWEYRHKNPTIQMLRIRELDWEEFKEYKKVLYFQYTNSQHGFLEMETGKVHWVGQD